MSAGIVLFLVDNVHFLRVNYPWVDPALEITYSMIEPSRNIYKEGCFTDPSCTPGGYFYRLGTSVFEGFVLDDVRRSDCSKPVPDEISLTEFHLINEDDCTRFNSTTNNLVIGRETTFCSVQSTIGI